MSGVKNEEFVFRPGKDGERVRLDRFLSGCALGLTRSQIKHLIDHGDVAIDGQPATKPGHRLSPGAHVRVTIRPPVEPRAVPQDIALTVLHEDEHLIVVHKPAGMVVHPAPGHPDGTLVNALLAHCRDLSGVGGQLRPGIVHRLDRDTSGVMVATKDDRTHVALAQLFKRHDIIREYLAVISQVPRAATGTFDTLYGRHPTRRKEFSSRTHRGKRAVTHYRVERAYADQAALVRCTLETGRTHQIRVHFADHGSPIVGDPVYGRRYRGSALAELARELGRQALHAASLGFEHPITGQLLRFESELPADMQALLAQLGRLAA